MAPRSANRNLTLRDQPRRLGSSFKEGNVSYIIMTALSVALIRIAIVWVYPKQANWDE